MKVTYETNYDIVLKKSSTRGHVLVDLIQNRGTDREVKISQDMIVRLPTKKKDGMFIRVHPFVQLDDVNSVKQGDFLIEK